MSYGPFFNFILCKIPARGVGRGEGGWGDEDGPGRGHLYHTGTFLVSSIVSCQALRASVQKI